MNITMNIPIDVSLDEFMENIVAMYHSKTREEMAQSIVGILLLQEEFPSITELTILQKRMQAFATAMEEHLQKEEEILFPLIAKLETTADLTYKSVLQRPMAKIEEEHREHSLSLEGVQESITTIQNIPECNTVGVQKCITQIQALVELTKEHIYVEDYILFGKVRQA